MTQISNAKPGYLNAADLAGTGDVTFSGVSFEADSVTLDVGGLSRHGDSDRGHQPDLDRGDPEGRTPLLWPTAT